MKRSQGKLTEQDWRIVFQIRCRSKSGTPPTQEQLRFIERAMREDPKRYSKMSDEVFVATAPFGSIRRR